MLKKVNRYNVALGGILLLIIYAITMNILRLHWQEEQFLVNYKKEQQAQNDLLALKMEYYINRNGVSVNDLEHLLAIVQALDTSEEVWKYIYYNDTVLYYKNHDLIRNNGTISLLGFEELLKLNNMISTNSLINTETASFGIGFAIEEKSILMDTGFGKNKSILMLENIAANLILALVAGGLLWRVMKKDNKCIHLGNEIIVLNNKVESLHLELSKCMENSQRIDKAAELVEDNRYDKDLVRVLLAKMKEEKYYPLTMIYIQFHMGNLYFSKSKMQKIEKELRGDNSRMYELFEVGKGEYLLLMIRTDILGVMQIQEAIEKRAHEIARNNTIGVTVKSRSITNENTDLEQEFANFKME